MDPRTLIDHLIETYGMTPRDAERVATELLKGNPGSVPDDPELGKTYSFLKALGTDPVPHLPVHTRPNASPELQRAVHNGINQSYVNSSGLGPSVNPNQAYHDWATAHPVRGLIKNDLRQAAAFFARPVASPDHEKISAHKMLKEYLQSQDVQRANAAAQDSLNADIANPQAWDNFFTSTGRPPASLGDFANAGAMLASQPKPEIK